ncbi:hypothetical protein [Curtobacterium sp. VKM Ac-2922]|uniref:hypothetical protein n=1 Tax=Curtobacterium sp. VKM Ac-2922 TaxID=2929475 RepID=UPI001FB4A8E2|nr:hypothetical protein [Curtobacterium sp. VKM Ac-2922]MCJ1712620.1 hypothetical protein [Curtobacterium sp. VKM Ac-2922]
MRRLLRAVSVAATTAVVLPAAIAAAVALTPSAEPALATPSDTAPSDTAPSDTAPSNVAPTDAPPTAARLTGPLVFSTVPSNSTGQLQWFAAAVENGYAGRALAGTSAAAAAARGPAWTTPVLDSVGPLSVASAPTACLTGYGLVFSVAPCNGSAVQDWRWVAHDGGLALQNVLTGFHIGTGNRGGNDDVLEGDDGSGYPIGTVDTSFLTGDGTVTPPVNGGIAPVGDGTPATVRVGDTVDVSFGMTTTAPIDALRQTVFQATAPQGTNFVVGTRKLVGAYRASPDDPWTAVPAISATVVLGPGGTSLRGTVLGTGTSVHLPAGGQLRWTAPLAVRNSATPGTFDVEFQFSGSTT